MHFLPGLVRSQQRVDTALVICNYFVKVTYTLSLSAVLNMLLIVLRL